MSNLGFTALNLCFTSLRNHVYFSLFQLTLTNSLYNKYLLIIKNKSIHKYFKIRCLSCCSLFVCSNFKTIKKITTSTSAVFAEIINKTINLNLYVITECVSVEKS